MGKFKCGNSDVVKLTLELIDNAEKLGPNVFNPFSKSDIKAVKQALKEYNVDCGICVNMGNNDYKCHQAADQKLFRAMPFMKKIYILGEIMIGITLTL